MLPFDFTYYRPENLDEAVELYQKLTQAGKQPMIFSGGTELITLGRIDLAFTEAVIDIKGIAECQLMQISDQFLYLGSSISLAAIEEADLFPLLSKTAGEIADHTARVKITLGGNICAQIFYREAVLPFLLTDSQLLLAGPAGKKFVSIHEVFQGQLQLAKNEFLVLMATETRFIRAPFYTYKRRQQWDTGYPLITIAALKIDGGIRVAISGLCPFPFRSEEVEDYLNSAASIEERIDQAMTVLPQPILDDVEGSKDYRLFVLRGLLLDVMTALNHV